MDENGQTFGQNYKKENVNSDLPEIHQEDFSEVV